MRELLGFKRHPERYSDLRSSSYLIELRLSGRTKTYLKELSYQIAEKFRVRGAVRKRVVPHVSLFGPFKSNHERELTLKFSSMCKRLDLVKYRLNGFDHFEDRVVHVHIDPSTELIEFRKELAKSLIPVCIETKQYDYVDDFKFHATLAFKDIEKKFDAIWDYLQTQETPLKEEYVLRITLLKRGRILKEYDLIQRRMLSRKEALNRGVWKETRGQLKKIRANNGKRVVQEVTVEGDPYFISDLHLDHANIIRYCHRPFESTEEMNETLVNNWNNTIKDTDQVFFLGDMSFGKGSRGADYWIKKLKGKIYFIKGNHEKIYYKNAFNELILNCKGKKIYLVHDPSHIPRDWVGWAIHGHKHNNSLVEFPLVNEKNKTINVSCELLNYTPKRLIDITKNLD
ncbi:MAG: 2'-5' RNA ligase family protein [archaeon]